MSKYLVYGLADPDSLDVRYIGKSSSGLRRPLQHGLPSQLKKTSYKTNWIRSLLTEGKTYRILVLQEVSSAAELADAERHWIREARGLGWRLTNLTDGGEGIAGFRHSETSRLKMSRTHTGRKRTAATRAKIAAARTGPRPPSVGVAVSKARKALFAIPPERAAMLRCLYEDERKTAAEIGKVFDRSPQAVCRWLKQIGVVVRTPAAVANARSRNPEGRWSPSGG